MNKLFAQTLDRFSMSFLLPKFSASGASKASNFNLLEQPALPPKRLLKTPKIFIKKTRTKGNIEVFDFAFPSGIETPVLKNNTVYGRYFKVKNGVAKSTAIMLHGIHECKHRYTERHALQLAKSGHNCIVMTLPYHVERAPKKSASGNQFLSTDLRGIFEALQQGVKDVLALINWLTANGEKRIGLIGVNLGALIAGFAASATRRINYLVMLAPATSPLHVTGYTKGGRLNGERIKKTGLSQTQFVELFKPWDLETHKPLVSADRTLIIKAEHDAFIPGESVERLWSAWGKPKIQRYAHGHLTALSTRRAYKDIVRFLDGAFPQQQSARLFT